jgi:hypothetical protein
MRWRVEKIAADVRDNQTYRHYRAGGNLAE